MCTDVKHTKVQVKRVKVIHQSLINYVFEI